MSITMIPDKKQTLKRLLIKKLRRLRNFTKQRKIDANKMMYKMTILMKDSKK